ncbi:hypothetical protein [Melghirimyces algeriensis]|uniref:Uncharacterized protein n=1 Tax=Melghirimyces algeriensis TaxID=910412 RepID=A0A521AL57_9BACL|nr:hypothetical protein [Melghirimyces algeriensis]SMO35594.1 hypothetical protein SAMN06264849_101212 [Melghirimyces algeriensis]
MKHPFPTTQRNPWRFQPFSGQPLFLFVRWLGPEGVKRTPSTSSLEERDAETEISPSPLCHEPQWIIYSIHLFYFQRSHLG